MAALGLAQKIKEFFKGEVSMDADTLTRYSLSLIHI